MIKHFAKLAKELGVVLPISFFERAGQVFFNSLAVAEADGTIKGFYRKSHNPPNPGYEEKFYFSPENRGFKSSKLNSPNSVARYVGINGFQKQRAP